MYALYVTENDIDDQPVELDNMIAGAERADSLGADVITESLGYDLLQSSCTGQTYPENYDSINGNTTVAAKAANIATKKGILFVATAGNDGGGVPGYGDYILTPGDADSALTVGAYNLDAGVMASFSGYGPNSAGVIKPDVCAEGQNAAIYTPSGNATDDGTSFSTPQVAGWATCLLQANPGSTPYQLRQAIIKCASSYSHPGNQTGYGIANFECSQIVLDVKDTPPPFSATNWVIASPNPFYDELKLSVSPNASEVVNFRLTDMTGRAVASFSQYMYIGYNTPFSVSLPQLPTGIYILKAESVTQRQVIKLEKR
jgi:serine protease AprX